jgi:hypothetical protein
MCSEIAGRRSGNAAFSDSHYSLMTSGIAKLAADILQSVILGDTVVLQRKLYSHTLPAQRLSHHEQEQWELLDAVRERLLVVSMDRCRRTITDEIAFSVCVQMLRNLISSRN